MRFTKNILQQLAKLAFASFLFFMAIYIKSESGSEWCGDRETLLEWLSKHLYFFHQDRGVCYDDNVSNRLAISDSCCKLRLGLSSTQSVHLSELIIQCLSFSLLYSIYFAPCMWHAHTSTSPHLQAKTWNFSNRFLLAIKADRLSLQGHAAGETKRRITKCQVFQPLQPKLDILPVGATIQSSPGLQHYCWFSVQNTGKAEEACSASKQEKIIPRGKKQKCLQCLDKSTCIIYDL